jgi:hypothetical protein
LAKAKNIYIVDFVYDGNPKGSHCCDTFLFSLKNGYICINQLKQYIMKPENNHEVPLNPFIIQLETVAAALDAIHYSNCYPN